MPVSNSIAALQDEVAGWRHELHRNPQTCYEEEFAAAFVAAKLTEWGIPFRAGMAKTGIVATITGQRTDSGRALAFRADMDALDITEATGLPYASKNPGKMHACGHDGHTATLLGVAKHLAETRNFDGTVHLIFQPAEEGGAGAMRLIEEGLFREFPVDAIYGLHNWPYLDFGKIATRKGPVMACSDQFRIVVRGSGGHAATPHLTTDPLVVAAHIVTALQTIVSRNVDPGERAVLSITNIAAGTGALNIIADSAVMTGTIRAFRPDTRKELHLRLREIVEGVARGLRATASIEPVEGEPDYDPTVNSGPETDFALAAASDVVGAANVDDDFPPVMAAEDFGAYLKEIPGCFIALGQRVKDEGSRHNQGLHTSRYDFNDDILSIGISWFTRLAETHMPL